MSFRREDPRIRVELQKPDLLRCQPGVALLRVRSR
jgi:hypothetical protein